MDAKDWIVLSLLLFLALATWGWVYLHPSVSAYSIAVGGTGGFTAVMHWMWIRDDKVPDQRKDA